MKKLALELDRLDVASFTTGEGEPLPARGTLHAHESHLTGTETYRCPTPTCPTLADTCLCR